jgi:hypothetical protein
VSAVSSEAAAPTGSAEVVMKRAEYKREKDSNMAVDDDDDGWRQRLCLMGRLDKIG